MENNIRYIELKSGFSDKGPAWIGKVEFSKSGQTIYFNGKAFKKMTGTGFAYSDSANYYDLEEREGYWISAARLPRPSKAGYSQAAGNDCRPPRQVSSSISAGR